MPPPLRQQDLDWLVCPVCHAALRLAGLGILCAGCHRLYPIVDGLPILLPDRATRQETPC